MNPQLKAQLAALLEDHHSLVTVEEGNTEFNEGYLEVKLLGYKVRSYSGDWIDIIPLAARAKVFITADVRKRYEITKRKKATRAR